MDQSIRSGFHFDKISRLILVIITIITAATITRSQQPPATQAKPKEPIQSSSQNPPASSNKPADAGQQPKPDQKNLPSNPTRPAPSVPFTPPTAQRPGQPVTPLALDEAVRLAGA